MELNKTASSIPYKTPAEVDGQNRLQSSQEQSRATSSQTYSSGDTVTISAEARALGTQQNSDTNTVQTLQATQRVTPERAAREAQQYQQQTGTQQPQQQQSQDRNTSSPAQESSSNQTPANPPEGNRNIAAQQPVQETQQSSQAETAAPQRTGSLRAPTTPPQGNAPQNYNTPLKPAQESPVTSASGLSPGRTALNITI